MRLGEYLMSRGCWRLAIGCCTAIAPPPEWFMEQLLDRDDCNIGVLEAVAIIVSVASFMNELRERDVALFVDNMGVLAGYVNGASRQPETNYLIAQFWFKALQLDADFQCWRVESRANIADGLTRHVLDVLRARGG